MESLIHIINKLQDVFAVVGEHRVDLPQIVVVGSQSSGKSSVLESLVGRSFLPRGTGIVTRAPLILQMVRYNREEREQMLEATKNDKIKEWARFLHNPERVFHNFDEVRNEIKSRTDFLAGSNRGITNEPIVLKVYTNQYDLTFVDLPGITKVAVGDQPENIDEQVQNLIVRYAEQPNSVILAVVTANTDPATSESLKIARRIDPNGVRTVAVVTKLDLIDKGTVQDAADLLCGQKIPVKLGIVGVVNRSQKDINDNKSLKETLKSEREFLKANYPEIYKQHGNKVLANTLQNILMMHIKHTYPALRKELYDTKARLENELRTLQTPDEKVSFVLGLLKDICRSYCDTVNGNRKDISESTIMGGAKITQIINKEYVDGLNKIDPLLGLTDEKIGTILLNSAGTSKNSFVNEKALGNMISRQLQHLIEPAMVCVDLVCVEMLTIFDSIDQCHLIMLKRFPKLNADVRNALNRMLADTLASIKWFIASYIETYQACLNTANPDFVAELARSSDAIRNAFVGHPGAAAAAAAAAAAVNKKGGPSSDEYARAEEERARQLVKRVLSGLDDLDETLESSKQVRMHRDVTRCYFDFVRRMVRDFVPKRIVHKMVNHVLDTIDHYMHDTVFAPYVNNKCIDQVLVEEDDAAADRNRAERTLNAVNNALKTMMDIQCV